MKIVNSSTTGYQRKKKNPMLCYSMYPGLLKWKFVLFPSLLSFVGRCESRNAKQMVCIKPIQWLFKK